MHCPNREIVAHVSFEAHVSSSRPDAISTENDITDRMLPFSKSEINVGSFCWDLTSLETFAVEQRISHSFESILCAAKPDLKIFDCIHLLGCIVILETASAASTNAASASVCDWNLLICENFERASSTAAILLSLDRCCFKCRL